MPWTKILFAQFVILCGTQNVILIQLYVLGVESEERRKEELHFLHMYKCCRNGRVHITC